MPKGPLILVIDDEPQVHRFLGPALEAVGYTHVGAESGRAGLEILATKPPEALILDLELPDVDGALVLANARLFFTRPIIIISERGDAPSKIRALDLGADDYVQKPFDVGELLARLRAVARYKTGAMDAKLTVVAGDIEINLARRLVKRWGAEVHLTVHEYDILAQLVNVAGRVMTHNHLLSAAWGPEHADNVQYLRVVMQRLRKKLEADPANPRYLLTETGVGYRFRLQDDD
jgi:two-component system, OmpR family, KDP operon response regulator KdpE